MHKGRGAEEEAEQQQKKIDPIAETILQWNGVAGQPKFHPE